MKQSFSTIFLALICLYLLDACSSQMQTAKKKFDMGEYQPAIMLYKQLAQKPEHAAKSNFFIAESYRLSNRLDSAEIYYQNAIAQGYTREDTKFHYAMSLKMAGKYNQAAQILEEYVKTGKSSEYVKRAKREIENLKQINTILNQKNYYEVQNLESVNTPQTEFSPVIFQDKLLISASRKEDLYTATGMGYLGIYAYNLADLKNEKPSSQIFDQKIWKDEVNEGSPTFSRDGKLMIFARGNPGGWNQTQRDVDLYFSVRQADGSWDEPNLLAISIPDAWDACPFIHPNGKTLYFASNRKGGYGGIDLYVCDITNTGKATNVRNLGKDINTEGNEMFPFVADNGKLYFASDGHAGLGGLDIFEATRSGGKITIRNMGKPLNSSSDDFSLIFDTDTTGYFASNRAGGKGDDDIYRFRDATPNTKIVNYFLTITTITRNDDGTEQIVPQVKIEWKDNNKQLLQTFVSDENGKIKPFPVKISTDYNFTVSKEGFFKKDDFYTTYGKAIPQELLTKAVTDTILELKVELEPIVIDKPIILQNINYDFNSDAIRPDAALELDKLVKIMQDNPDIIIELSSHTDAVGSRERNLDLSQRRAKNAVAYIVSKGISEDRLIAKGYGEDKLLVQTQEANEQNRRTEFKVIRIKKE
ncbi:MAG: OmpA family protein [Microscillaceae bacterium]|nr:OmpA family protein [Microscillaceae bacterium]MDW8461696.1 OmpA family protein [Cytophagales bacterium]